MKAYGPNMTAEEKALWREEMSRFASLDIQKKEQDRKDAEALERNKELAQRLREEQEKAKIEEGRTRDLRVVPKEDLRPDPYRHSSEDVAANPGDDDEGFEKRRYDLEGKK